MNDPCERSAECIDIMVADAWDAFGAALAGELGRVEAAEGTIVHPGAGSGWGVRTVCAALRMTPGPGGRTVPVTTGGPARPDPR
ncbi:hypothetical protein Shyhy02_40610 [Streptomyces hygroscopicus subsp. hygroscopicus]|nr:hypothetical protein Shyhy02_40610 [Streptomyces hygroscopicus subsp. hygroscopicus]